MNNPRKILSLEDIKLLETNGIEVPDKELNDEEMDNLNIKLAINLKQDDSERIIDLLNCNDDEDGINHKHIGFDDRNFEKQWEDVLERGRALRVKYPDMKMPDFLICNSDKEQMK